MRFAQCVENHHHGYRQAISGLVKKMHCNSKQVQVYAGQQIPPPPPEIISAFIMNMKLTAHVDRSVSQCCESCRTIVNSGKICMKR